MLKTVQINNQIVKPIPGKTLKPKQILGYDISPELYSIWYLCAQKKTGKTTVESHILDVCADEHTKVIIFCPSSKIDDNWKHIKHMLDSKNILYKVYHSTYHVDSDGRVTDLLPSIMNYMETEKIQAEEREREELEKTNNISYNRSLQMLKYNESYAKIKYTPPKKKSPRFIIIFDDLSDELRKQNIPKLLKNMRHFDSKVIISSQSLKDLQTDGAREQVDIWILFRGQQEETLKEIFNITFSNLVFSFEKFKQIYIDITTKTPDSHNFMYIDRVKGEIRKNFNEVVQL